MEDITLWIKHLALWMVVYHNQPVCSHINSQREMKMTLFDLEDGDRFEWQGKKYTLIQLDEDYALVYNEDTKREQIFNSYASITKIEE